MLVEELSTLRNSTVVIMSTHDADFARTVGAEIIPFFKLTVAQMCLLKGIYRKPLRPVDEKRGTKTRPPNKIIALFMKFHSH
ncbi:hypothetical protein EV681_0030 [Advenella incenata]|uniref:Uncharacterized protein n=1 Tax=Advenella incenata TaxID=267800 RepID=A0A4Q7VPR8_9BURK|nr:hypothetical protein EV681_0030 [Advenella incenata]